MAEDTLGPLSENSLRAEISRLEDEISQVQETLSRWTPVGATVDESLLDQRDSVRLRHTAIMQLMAELEAEYGTPPLPRTQAELIAERDLRKLDIDARKDAARREGREGREG